MIRKMTMAGLVFTVLTPVLMTGSAQPVHAAGWVDKPVTIPMDKKSGGDTPRPTPPPGPPK